MHYYKRNLGDYAKKAGRLSMLQHGAYTLLIDACYDREQFPTLEEAIEWTWASTTEEVEAVSFVLRKFFTLDGDWYVQSRIAEEISAYHEKAETNKRIANEREAKRKGNSTKREQSVNEAPPNQEPRTTNQEPGKSKDLSPQGAAPSRKSGTALPADWVLPRQWGEWALQEREDLTADDVREIALTFRDHWVANANRREGKKADWLATWRNWVRREKKRTKQVPSVQAARLDTMQQIFGGNGHGTDRSIIDVTPTGSAQGIGAGVPALGLGVR